jgi:PAS domain S-box-containing protein
MPTAVTPYSTVLEVPLAKVVEFSPDAILIVDPDGTIGYVNPATERLFGYAPQELIGKPLETLIPERFRGAHARHRSDYAKKPVPRLMGTGMELSGRHKSGREFPIDVMLTELIEGKRRLIAAQVRDMSGPRGLERELKMRNAELYETTTLLNNILDSSTEYSIIGKDLEGRIATWNEGARRLYGYTKEEIIGRHSAALHTPEDVAGGVVQSLLDEVRLKGKAEGRFERVRKNGTRFPASLAVTLRRDNEGMPVGYLAISRDITAQKVMEERIARKNREIMEQYGHLREANRLKSEFLANMSHELRTPLNAIIGFAEIMQDGRVGPLADDHKEYIGDILVSARHLLQLINDVLDLSKIEAGRMEFRPEPIDLEKLVGEVRDVVRTLISRKHLQLETVIDAQLNDIVIDPAKLKQVLYNYLSNAIKFTAEGGRVVVRATAENPAFFRMEVEDNGVGIKADDLRNLFVEFQQLDSPLTKRYQGTGLGLALTRRIVEAQSGRVGVDSEPGRGSLFYAVLPRHPAAAGTPPLPQLVRQESTPDLRARILVIEDDAGDRAWIIHTLSKEGYRVDTAETGAQALTLCRERAYSAITLDLLLPDTTGWELLRMIRANGPNRATPVVVLSVVADRAAGSAFAIRDYLVKPAGSDEILGALRRAGMVAPPSRKIVVLDSDPLALQAVAEALSADGYEMLSASDSAEALRVIEHARPDALIIDLLAVGVRESDGFEFLARLRDMPGGGNLPIFVCTDLSLHREDAARLLETARMVTRKGSDASQALLSELRNVLGGGAISFSE